MQSVLLIRKMTTKWGGAMVLRAAIVGANFAVMIGLAAVLGIAAFGALIYVWSLALVAATVLSAGGPMILLRRLTDGSGLSRQAIVLYALVVPCGLALLLWLVLSSAVPSVGWAPVLAAGGCINFSACLASILRARGSVMVSMALRDAGPFVALGIGAVLAQGAAPQAGLYAAAMVLFAMSFGVLVWARGLPDAALRAGHKPARNDQLSLWGASVIGVGIAQMDLIIGGAFLSVEALGLYAVLRRIANLVALPVSVATWVSAPDVSAAFGARDWSALRIASAKGSAIAWLPALGLCGIGVAGVCLALLPPLALLSPMMGWIFAALLFGALLQAFWASGYTVATLTDAPALALVARLTVLAGYLGMALWHGPALTPLGNALAYVLATSAGSLWLWWMLWRRFGVDTSALALMPKEGVFWRTS